MTNKRIATLIEQEVQKPAEDIDNSSAISTTKNTQLTDIRLTSESLFKETQELWKEITAFDKEHQLSGRVGAQIWRLGKLVAKPAFILSVSGLKVAFVTVSNPDNRAALAKWFARSKPAQDAKATLEPVED